MMRVGKNKSFGQYDDYVVVDVETTGLAAGIDELIEVAGIRVRNNEIIEELDQLIRPQHVVPFHIEELTHITNDMLQSCPTLQEVKDKILNFIGDDLILGHNVTFDIKFLIASLQALENRDYIDTLKLSRRLHPEFSSHKLTDLVAHYKLYQNTHRAIDDCRATKQLYDVYKEEFNQQLIKQRRIIEAFTTKPIEQSIPLTFTKEMTPSQQENWEKIIQSNMSK